MAVAALICECALTALRLRTRGLVSPPGGIALILGKKQRNKETKKQRNKETNAYMLEVDAAI